jgi:hypothetical protein
MAYGCLTVTSEEHEKSVNSVSAALTLVTEIDKILANMDIKKPPS